MTCVFGLFFGGIGISQTVICSIFSLSLYKTLAWYYAVPAIMIVMGIWLICMITVYAVINVAYHFDEEIAQ